MATLVLSSLGESIGASLFGAPGALLGRAVGAVAGASVDQRLFAPSERGAPNRGRDDLRVLGSSEGAVIPRIFGTVRVGGQVIWAAPYRVETSSAGSGKGTGRQSETATETYSVSFAIGLAEGETSAIERIWADGKVLDLSTLRYRFYQGSEIQTPDPVIEAALGTENAPAYRGLSYIVFEDLNLAQFGNRIPQFSFEISRPLAPLTQKIRAVNLIPGATEFGYHPTPHRRNAGFGRSASENAHNAQGFSDWEVSLNQLKQHCNACDYVSLVVSWFGTDLRASQCRIVPGSEGRKRLTQPTRWEVSGIRRSNAHAISHKDGRPAFGGTPSDSSVLAALRDLKKRGYKILFYPFLLMDIPSGNGLPDPYGGAEQAVYPWRGHITASHPPGHPASPDGQAAMKSETDAFFGNARASDFRIAGERVLFEGDNDSATGLRRMILHYAHLCALAGGVDAFLTGSELRGLTRLRHAANAFSAVDNLLSLAKEVRTILPGAKLSYAADWSEYSFYTPPQLPNAVLFPLDRFWADSTIDFVGIDYYMPLADWRDGDNHLDTQAGWENGYDLDYLRSNIAGGEYYDWYYASREARESQTRLPISEARWRAKDIASWWKSPHLATVQDISGTTLSSNVPTDWQPANKPVWFTELGCGAVDKGANQPNVFFDPKSSDSALPYFSSGKRDDLMQARFLEAMLSAMNPADSNYLAKANPASPDNPEKFMLSPEHIFIWAWDARPYPAFPAREEVWGDAPNWATGHWINGRITGTELSETIADILHRAGFSDFSFEAVKGLLRGFLIDEIGTPRAALESLMRLFFFDAAESGGVLRFFPRRQTNLQPIAIDEKDCAAQENEEAFQLTRLHQEELPASVKLLYLNQAADYQQSVAEARLPVGGASPLSLARLPIVAKAEEAQQAAEEWLYESRLARERAVLALSPKRMELEPGDLIRFKNKVLRIQTLQESGRRRLEAVSCNPKPYNSAAASEAIAVQAVPHYGAPELFLLDLPAMRGDNPYRLFAAASADPWPGQMALYHSVQEENGFEALSPIKNRAIMGISRAPLNPHAPARWDEANQIEVELAFGTLASHSTKTVLGGANLAALRARNEQGEPQGEWEIFQFRNADLVGENRYRLSGLLRGLAGSDGEAANPKPAGAEFVLLDKKLHALELSHAQQGQTRFYRAGAPNRPLTHDSYRAMAHQFQGLALRPFAPVHLQAERTSDNSLRFQWIRRTRIGGDSWEKENVPLSEESESYRLELLQDGVLIRRFTATHPSVLFSAAQALAALGTPPQRFTLRVFQQNALFGRSSPKEADFYV